MWQTRLTATDNRRLVVWRACKMEPRLYVGGGGRGRRAASCAAAISCFCTTCSCSCTCENLALTTAARSCRLRNARPASELRKQG